MVDRIDRIETVFSNAFNVIPATESDHSDLFIAIRQKDWTNSIRLCKAYPEDAKVWSYRVSADGDAVWTRLPIHEACINNPPLELMEALVAAYPESTAALDLSKRLPLHNAAVYNASYEVIELLVKACPASVNVTDMYNKNPAMLLLSCSREEEDIRRFNLSSQLLGERFSGKPVCTFSAVFNDFDTNESIEENKTPLLKNIKRKRWTEAFSILQSQPSQAKEWTTHRDGDGDIVWKRLPIHEACINGAPLNLIQSLLKAYKDGLQQPDQSNRLPLHHAAVHASHTNIIEFLAQEYPDSLHSEDNFGKTPLKCLQCPTQGMDNTMYCTNMEILSQSPDDYKEQPNNPSNNNKNQPTQKEMDDLKKLLLEEQKQKISLNKQLQELSSQLQSLQDITDKKNNENDSLKHALTILQKEYTKLERDVFSRASVFAHEERTDIDSLTTTSVSSYSLCLDDAMSKERTLKNIKAEVKERESMLERAMISVKSNDTSVAKY